MATLSVENLTKIYSTKKGVPTKALDNVSLDFGDKGLVFLLGKSGSGKSTLLNLLGGIDSATDGEIIVKGRSSATFSASDFDSYRNTYVGFVFQEYNLIPDYTVGANVGLALELQGKTADKKQVDTILRRVGLVDDNDVTFYYRMTNELSGGQKQRVAIARALIKDPQIILADEPTGGLDSKTGTQLYEILKDLAKDKLVIVVTHDRESAEKYGGRIIELADGEIINDTASIPKKESAAENCAFIRSRLPLKRSFVMGSSGLKHKPFRLTVSILLSVVAFVVFGFSLTATMVDEYTTHVQTLYDNDISMITIESDTRTEKLLENGATQIICHDFSDRQMSVMTEYNNGKKPMTVFTSYEYVPDITVHLGEDKNKLNNLNNTNRYYKLGLSRMLLAELDPITGMSDAVLMPDKRFADKNLCKLPQTYDEIAVTDIRADMFIEFGYVNGEDGTVTRIEKPDDLIGKKLGSMTICGVFSTETNKAYFEPDEGGEKSDYDESYDSNYFNGAMNSVFSYGFVRKGFCQYKGNNDIIRVLLKLSGNTAKDKDMLDKLSYEDGGLEYKVRLYSPFFYFMYNATMFRTYMFLPCMIVAAVFSVFAALLMMNFLNVSLDFKKKDIGILRALGARRKDVIVICLIESMLIALIDLVLSIVAVVIMSVIFNKIYFVSLLNFGFTQFALMFLLCGGVAALATVLPVVKMTNKKPIDIINGK